VKEYLKKYLIDPELLRLAPENSFFDMPDLLELVLGKQYPIVAFPIHEYWLDIGFPSTLQKAIGEWK
jgi:NDP-sugar pyrophosphorylase family protein